MTSEPFVNVSCDEKGCNSVIEVPYFDPFSVTSYDDQSREIEKSGWLIKRDEKDQYNCHYCPKCKGSGK